MMNNYAATKQLDYNNTFISKCMAIDTVINMQYLFTFNRHLAVV